MDEKAVSLGWTEDAVKYVTAATMKDLVKDAYYEGIEDRGEAAWEHSDTCRLLQEVSSSE